MRPTRPPRLPRPRRRRRGFTLVELIVVLLVLGVMLAVTVPGLRPPARNTEDAAARELLSAATAARAAAATRGSVVTLTIELATGAYAVTAQRSPGDAADTLRSGRLALPPGTRLEGGRDGWAVMTFHPLGHVRADPLAAVGNGASHDLVISPWTASVAVRAR